MRNFFYLAGKEQLRRLLVADKLALNLIDKIEGERVSMQSPVKMRTSVKLPNGNDPNCRMKMVQTAELRLT